VSKLAVGQLEGLASEGYRISVASGSAFAPVGSILQVVSTTKTDSFSTTSTSFTDATGLSVSVTPKFSSSKILVTINLQISQDNQGYGFAQLVRDSTAIGIGDAAGSRNRTTVGGRSNDAASYQSATFLDSPNTTSATTYKVQVRTQQGGAGATVYLNRGVGDTDSAGSGSYRSISTITVMEVAG
jgi:hypothetical protein